jgi:DNA invertase Pin-like site-specific DNA recombinase
VRLPRALDDLAGLRAALWVRESTAGQWDNFGPDAQREQYARAVERWGLVDTGVNWTVAHSGWKIARHPAWHDMLAQAGDTFDVLVVGYASRFARSLEAHVDARRAFHAQGAAILFADERVLTSDEDAWERWAREAVEAEAYSRKLSRRVREGLAAKRRRMGEPGGRPPYGYARAGRPPVLVPDEDRLAQVRAVFASSAGGAPDREVAREVALPLWTVRGILANPIYIGRLHDGTEASVPPVIDMATWNAVTKRRATRATRAGRPADPRRPYGIPNLVCESCGARMTGDTGYYRHHDVCPGFRDAVRALRRRPIGESAGVPAELYDAAVADILRRASLRADSLEVVVAGVNEAPIDQASLVRVDRERDAALSRYRRDRDAMALDRAMAALDAREDAARAVMPILTPAEVVEYLRDLPRLWREATETRSRLAESLFERVEALGTERLTFHPSAEAITHGLADAMPSSGHVSVGYGRGERAQGNTNQLRYTVAKPRRRLLRKVG